MNPIPISLVVEDDPSEAVVRKILSSSGKKYAIGQVYGKTGFGYIKSRIRGFNNAAKGTPFFVLVDLDEGEYAPALIEKWSKGILLQSNLIFRIAVREVESWVLADASSFSRYVGISSALIPKVVEEISDPKRCLIKLVARTRRRALREDIVPPPGSLRVQGPNYNGCLVDFVHKHWDPHEARKNSPSLNKTMDAVRRFNPGWA